MILLGVILGCILLIVVFLSLISCGDYFKNQVAVYPVDKTHKGLLPLNPTRYKLFRKSQIVIYWMPGFNFLSGELVKCIVHDRLNWSGEYLDGSGKFMMVKKTFFQTFPIDKDVHYVSWLK